MNTWEFSAGPQMESVSLIAAKNEPRSSPQLRRGTALALPTPVKSRLYESRRSRLCIRSSTSSFRWHAQHPCLCVCVCGGGAPGPISWGSSRQCDRPAAVGQRSPTPLAPLAQRRPPCAATQYGALIACGFLNSLLASIKQSITTQSN